MSIDKVPAYLADPRPVGGRTYGTLFRDGDLWCIAGEPQVVQLSKRLFPGSRGRKGVAKFPASRRTLGDLNWLMLRYPLEIDDPESWSKAKAECVAHTLRTIEIADLPQKVAPPPMSFNGELREFQKEGLAAMLHHRRILLADEMGLGKTPQFLALLACTGEYPALVVVQPHLILQWTREIAKFLPGVEVEVLKGLTPYPLPKAHMHIVHYGLLRGWMRCLPGQHRVVCFDEVQELRHSDTQKYSAASLVAEGADTVIGLSGTPIHNSGGEIWSVLNILETHCLGGWESFTREWCDAYGSHAVTDPGLLGNRLREEGLMLRRTKLDVLPELPPKRRIVEEIDADEGVFGDLVAPAAEMARNFDGIQDALAKGRALREIVRSVRQATGAAKAAHVAIFVRALLEAGETCLLFAHHHGVIDILMEALADWQPGVVTGRESRREKDDSVRRFQEGETRLCIVSLRACSGLNMHAARCVVFAELDWSPAVHAQAEDRAHRIGQEDSVLAYYLVWNGAESSDPDIMERLGFKTSQFKGLMGDPDETEEDRALAIESAKKHMARIVAKLKLRPRDLGATGDLRPTGPQPRRA